MHKYLFFLFLFSFLNLTGQSVLVESILITGNKKTKEKVILRELNFQTKDSIALEGMMSQFAENRLFLMNTGLFSEVKINVKDWDTEKNKIQISIEIEEALPIYPIPIFELADRNFNIWWRDYQRDLSRINYGLTVYHINLTGRNDKLKVTGQLGYTQKVEVEYSLPGINKAKTIGVDFNFLHTRNKEIAYKTEANKLIFARAENSFLQRRTRAGIQFTYRPKLQTYQQLSLYFYKRKVGEIVNTDLNPFYLDQDRTEVNYFSLSYQFILDKRDIKPYPLTGNYLFFGVKKDGLSITEDRNALSLTGKYIQYIKLNKRLSVETIFKGKYSILRERQPYYDIRALGYFEDFIRGYEYYVIDGIDYFYNKSSFRFELFNGKTNFGKLVPIKALKSIDTRIYLAINNDIGYANDPFYNSDNPLNQELLWGKGIGLDLIVYYGLVLQFEYSFNNLNESGFFVHIRTTL